MGFYQFMERYDIPTVVLRLLLTAICSGIMGYEREKRNQAAGFRTYMIVSLASALVMMCNEYVSEIHGGDPVRLGAQVISGIGFLGAGTIVVTKHNQIKGLTTAAGLWAAAGVGLALGVGFYEAALVAGLVIFFVLTGLQKLDNRVRSKTRSMGVYIEIEDTMHIGNLVRHVRELGIDIEDVQLEHDFVPEDGARSLIATLKCKKRTDHLELMDAIRSIGGVIYVEEI